MADETTVDQQQLQSTIDELYDKLTTLFPQYRDALRASLNTIQVGENQTLGDLAAASNLSDAPVGDASTLRSNMGLGSASTHPDSRYAKLSGGNDFSEMPQVGGQPIIERGSNSNGWYIRFSNNIVICGQDTLVPSPDENGIFNWPFPFGGSNTLYVDCAARAASSSDLYEAVPIDEGTEGSSHAFRMWMTTNNEVIPVTNRVQTSMFAVLEV